MLRIVIPGGETDAELALEHLVCDINGTLAEDGLLIEGVTGRLMELSRHVRIHLLTADTYGTLSSIADQLRTAAIAADVAAPRWMLVMVGAEKAAYVRELGPERVAAVGNGANDAAMFALARLSIAVLGAEGSSVRAALAADALTHSINDALDLLLYPQRLVATLRP
jgi:soluble P-type ATPase